MGFMDWLRGGGFGGTPPVEQKAVNISNYAPPVMYGYAGRSNTGPAMYKGMYLTDQRDPGDSSNSLVRACLRRLATDVAQVPQRVYRILPGDKRDPVDGHPLIALLERPNPYMSGAQIRWFTQFCMQAHGNAYWRKIRAGNATTGNVIELWPVSPDCMAPVTYKNSGDFISAYRHWVGGGRYEDIPVANVIHFRDGIDPLDHRLGLSKLRDVVRAVATDEVATRFTYNLLNNGAVPGTLFMLDKDVNYTKEQASTIKAEMEERFGGDNQGRLGFLQGGIKAERMGFSPSDLDLAPLSGLPESRICAIFGVPPQVVGAKIGLEHATYSNYDQADESYTEKALLPALNADDETITMLLLPDFSAAPDEVVASDTSGLRALQDDDDAKSARIVAQWDAGIITLNQALTALGYDPAGTEGDQRRTVAAPPPMPGEDAPPPPGKGLRAVKAAAPADDFLALLATARAQAEARTQAALVREFGSLKRRAMHRVEGA
jgi:HK97 family phage portal protein